MKNLHDIWKDFLTVFGDIKISKWPMFFQYDPYEYQITGKEKRKILDKIKPGDIILRGYNSYLDGYFIPNFKNDQIGEGWSHGGIYIGNGMIIDAVSPNVRKVDILDFIRCDRIAIYRPVKGVRKAIRKAKDFLNKNIEYDFDFGPGENTLYCFELCASCYPDLEIPRQDVKILLGLIKRKDVYVAKSFSDSKDFKLIYVSNKKYNI